MQTWTNFLIDTAHVLPILFPFSTPGKYCYRAIATFTKHVTGMLHPTKLTPSSSEVTAPAPRHLFGNPVNVDLPIQQVSRPFSNDPVSESLGTQGGTHSAPDTPAPIQDSCDLRSSFSWPMFFSFQAKSGRASVSRSTSERSLRRRHSTLLRSPDGQNVGSPGKLRRSASMIDTTGVRYAGEASVYYNEEVGVIPQVVAYIYAAPRRAWHEVDVLYLHYKSR